MREIKFRAWDNVSKKMRTVTGFSQLPLDGTGTTRIYFLDGQSEVLLKDYPENIFVMQYTGLKDKNGFEIYESDVVLYREEEREINYSDGSFFVGEDDYLGSVNERLEVVGNKWEGRKEVKTSNTGE